MAGIVLLILGIALSIHYARERAWYMKQLQRAHAVEELKLKGKEGKKDKRKAINTALLIFFG